MFGLACLSCWFFLSCFAWSCSAIDAIATGTLKEPAHKIDNVVRGREKTGSRRLLAELLFALRPTSAHGSSGFGIGSRKQCSNPKAVVQEGRCAPDGNRKIFDCKRSLSLHFPIAARSKRASTAAMLALDISTPWVGAIAAASVHGLTDLRWRPIELAPYALMFAPIPTELVTVFFILASIRHFSHDIGIKLSLLLHATFVCLAPILPQVAWSIFATYYCACHTPLHFASHLGEIDGRFLATLIVIAMALALGMHDVETFKLTDTMQLGVIAHIVVDEIQEQ
jgi:hypothetical protein